MKDLWMLMLAALLLPAQGAAGDGGSVPQLQRDKATQHGEPAENPGAEDPDPVLSDPSLEKIGGLEVLVRRREAESAESSSAGLVEIINPFTVRKRGRFYGSLYEFHRNDNFDARNFFDPVGEPLPEFKRNQFGASFGAFVSGGLSLFGTFDGLRINRGSTRLSHVPTPEMKLGDFSRRSEPILDPATGSPFEGNRIPVSRLHPVSSRILALIPDPNRDDPDRNFVNSQPRVQNADSYSGRADWEAGSASRLFATFGMTDSDEKDISSLPGFGTQQTRRSQSIALDYTTSFSPSLVGDLRLQYNRFADAEISDHFGQTGLLSSLGISGLHTLDAEDEGYPELYISGYASLGVGEYRNSPRTTVRNTYSLDGNLTYVSGGHSLQFGIELNSRQVNNNRSAGLRRGRFEFQGDYSGDAFADFLLGVPNAASRGRGSDRADLRQRSWELSVRDDWKINPKFSLSMSLVYNGSPMYRSLHDNVSVFMPFVFEPPLLGELVVTGSARADELGLRGLEKGNGVYPDRNDLEPRVGFAYSPMGNNRLVLRSSYQIYHNGPDLYNALQYLGRNYPFHYVEKAESSSTIPELDLSHPFDTAVPPELTVRGFDPTMRTAYVQVWRASAENEIVGNWHLAVAYEGSKSTGLSRVLPANIPLPGPDLIQPRRPNPGYGRFHLVTASGSSSGHLLGIDMRRRFDRGFSLESGFTWNRAFTDTFYGDPVNARNLAAERGPVGYIAPRNFHMNYIFDLPFGRGRKFPTPWAGKMRWLFEGWRVSGITEFQDGRPFHPRLSGDANNDGLTEDRPDRLGPGVLPPGERSIDRWFAIGDFAEPAQYGFGNSGRGILLDPGAQVWDISLIKRTRISDEGKMLEFRVQLFNAFNHTNFDRPNATLDTDVFGKIFGAAESREIEVALKYSF